MHEIDARDPGQVQEYIAHSWYAYGGGDAAGQHPWQGETKLNYSGPKPPYDQLDVEGKYSWLKTPRWKGQAMEVGPAGPPAGGLRLGQRPKSRRSVDGTLAKLDVPVAALFLDPGPDGGPRAGDPAHRRLGPGVLRPACSPTSRTAIRAWPTCEKWDPATWPAEARGVGLSEAPRGALAHWIVIKDGAIDNYQLVVPSTWNASPRDAAGTALLL